MSAVTEAAVIAVLAAHSEGMSASAIRASLKRTFGINRRAIDLPEVNHARPRPTADQIVSAVAHRCAVDAKSIWTFKRGR